MFGFPLPSSFTLKNGLIVLCKEIENHPNVNHEVRKFELRVTPSTKTFDVMVWHPGTKKLTYANDIEENGLFYPVKYELPGHAHLYHYKEGGFVIRLIEKAIKMEVKTEHTIDRVVVQYDDSLSEIPCVLYLTTDKGEKIKINHVIK